ncbi:Aromatic-amino-acid aminotransferase [Candidatus Burkholderia brachyanthoides]|nr:Aromatic-amino-acid aminotransferase [Candidatus Burkholderia brachyanthoides]
MLPISPVYTDVLQKRDLLPFVDMAYQGFGPGLDDNAFAVRELARRGVPAFVANSFSKNFSLYGERCGGLHVICDDAAEVDTGLVTDQAERLKEEYGAYILRSGRMCVAGLNDSSVQIVADAIGKVLAK